MKKKGFTLIELLAVIVILAIIAVITVPKIADMITSSRQGGAEDSFYGTLKAAELGYAKALQSNTDLKEDICNITDSKITCKNGTTINVSGKTPESGTITISKSGTVSAKALTLNGYKCYGDLSTSNPCIKATEKTASETLIAKTITSGDGLYKDPYEDNRYIFRGSNPNNFIKFNAENWRIISVEKDGTLKIMRNEVLENPMPYDSPNRRLVKNNTFCRLPSSGCNVWNSISGTISNGDVSGTVTQNSEINDYLNNDYYSSLSKEAKNQIVNHIFYTGSFNRAEPDMTVEKMYKLERNLYWEGQIGLINPSDYMLASLNTACTTIESSRNGAVCKEKNYMPLADDIWWWSMNGNTYYSTNISVVGVGTAGAIGSENVGAICENSAKASHPYARPVVYLKANITVSGNGTSSNPYTIN